MPINLHMSGQGDFHTDITQVFNSGDSYAPQPTLCVHQMYCDLLPSGAVEDVKIRARR